MSNPQIRVNAMSFALMIRAIEERPRTIHQVAEFTGLHVWTVRHYLKALVKEGVAHIARWDQDSLGRDVTAYYSLGFGVNVPRAKKPGALKAKEYRIRKARAAAVAP